MCKTVDRGALIDWVANFLNHWEDGDMLYDQAAEIIVNQIIPFSESFEGSVHTCAKHIPNPEFYLKGKEGH
jgi:hypothetical protein